MNVVGYVVAGGVLGIGGMLVIFPMMVYALVLFEIVVNPFGAIRHLRRLKYSYAMSVGTALAFLLILALGVTSWFVPQDDTVSSPGAPTTTESRAFWFGLVGGVVAVMVARSRLRARRSASATRLPRFNPPPGWPPMPVGWSPPPGWVPPATFPPPPPGWQLWINT